MNERLDLENYEPDWCLEARPLMRVLGYVAMGLAVIVLGVIWWVLR